MEWDLEIPSFQSFQTRHTTPHPNGKPPCNAGDGTQKLKPLSAVSAVLVGSGYSPLTFTPWVAALFAAIGVWLLVAGVGVRKLKRREKTWVTPITAGRTAIFARSSAPVTSAFSGFLLGTALVGLARSWAPAMAYSGWLALAGAVAAAFAAVSAVVVERWCIDSTHDDEGDGPSHTESGSQSPRPQHSRTTPPASPPTSPRYRR